jgi:pimeloyl-ACP methyl ester carboxylesterase
MMLRLLAAAGLAASLAVPTASTAPERGRPVILLIHGRGMLDRDTAGTRKLWLDGLTAGMKSLTKASLLRDDDVRLVWYADVLDPRSSESCAYAEDDPRAKRDRKTDPNLKTLVSFVGNLMGALTSATDDSESASTLRGFAGDAAFLSDPRKRCASEQRLADALDRANREGRPVILVAHSLGAVVAYDYLSARRETGLVDRVVSVGSILGANELRRLLIGGDSTDTFGMPTSVKAWFNVRNDGDGLAATLPFGKDILTAPPADEPDRHEMVSYLRGQAGAGAILGGWCDAFSSAPAGCADVKKASP